MGRAESFIKGTKGIAFLRAQASSRGSGAVLYGNIGFRNNCRKKNYSFAMICNLQDKEAY